MNPLDVIPIPGHAGMWARRITVDMWMRAGSPPINSAGRDRGEQKRFWDLYQAGRGNPADDPDRPDQFRLPHMRGIALDVDTKYADAMRKAGFVRPVRGEPWHNEVPNGTSYPIATPPAPSIETEGLPEMFYAVIKATGAWYLVIPQGDQKPRAIILGANAIKGGDLPVIEFDWDVSVNALHAAVQF